LVDEDGLAGVTSNPAIFEKAIVGSTDYTELLETYRRRKEWDVVELYEELAVQDIRDAVDVLRVVYDRTDGRDGYVSLEVSPYLAHDTQRTIDEVRRLWRAVDRENLMVKVPATPEGIPAIEQLIGEGININVTLLFARERYVRVAEAYIAGLEKLDARGGDVSRVSSVASFFISRIDSAIDRIIALRLKSERDENQRSRLESLQGKVAIANARLTYRRYLDIFSGDRWQDLARKGARPQRILWASTGTKNPNYSDILYVEELIGPDTVNTLPPTTYDAFKQHGKLRPSLEENVEGANETMKSLEQLGISMLEVTDNLLADGVRLFSEAFGKLLNALDERCRVADTAVINRQVVVLPEDLAYQVEETVEEWQVSGKVRRLWSRDPSVWTRTGEEKWLGWLGISELQLDDIKHLDDIANEMAEGDVLDVLLLGMGGSSLCPEVLSRTFGQIEGYPRLHVLDSTDPDQIGRLERGLDLTETLCIVASKSGTTLEPNILKDYFFERARKSVGEGDAGDHFVAITDPGSTLQEIAHRNRYRHVFHGIPGIGGRFSALSDFGMVPAAMMGLDVQMFLDRAAEMEVSCSPCLPVTDNPGAVLGIVLGVCAGNGRDKVTLTASPALGDFGAWLEQLLAESTGKDGKGLIPVHDETLGPPEVYGEDRVFIYIRLDTAAESAQDNAIESLERDGHPVVTIHVDDTYDLGQEFFRWMFATAVAGSVMGINPFDQPDVEASKVATRKVMDEYEKAGSLPEDTPILESDGIKLYADSRNAASLQESVNDDPSLAGYLRAHLDRIESGDYFAILAYLENRTEYCRRLQDIRLAVRDNKHVATSLGFGPRYLHSTGQAHKGGPNSGVYLQVTSDAAHDIAIPGKSFTFGVVEAAQARGDLEVLAERGRRVLRVHLGEDVATGLERLDKVIREVLG
jgi:transaldolase/glucose-6-phosphate isomerase